MDPFRAIFGPKTSNQDFSQKRHISQLSLYATVSYARNQKTSECQFSIKTWKTSFWAQLVTFRLLKPAVAVPSSKNQKNSKRQFFMKLEKLFSNPKTVQQDFWQKNPAPSLFKLYDTLTSCKNQETFKSGSGENSW